MNATRKIVLTGPECTGKSTLTKMLADHFQVPFIEEYARTYIDHLNRPYTKEDLREIAKGQLELEEKKADPSKPYLFIDTDLYVIKVWSEHKYRDCDLQILKWISQRNYDLYLLMDIDIPWMADPQREHPDPLMRICFHHIYTDIVLNSGIPFAMISGNKEQRLQSAITAIRNTFPS